MSEHSSKSPILGGISGIVRNAFANAFPARTTLDYHDLNLMLAGSVIPKFLPQGEKLAAISANIADKAIKYNVPRELQNFCRALDVVAKDIKCDPCSVKTGLTTIPTAHITRLLAEKPALDSYLVFAAINGAENMLTGVDVLEATQLSKALSAIANHKDIPRPDQDSTQILNIYQCAPVRSAPYGDIYEWFGDGADLINKVKAMRLDILSALDNKPGHSLRLI